MKKNIKSASKSFNRNVDGVKKTSNDDNKKVSYTLVISGDSGNSTNIIFENRKDAEEMLYRNFVKTLNDLETKTVQCDVAVFDKKEGRGVISLDVNDDNAPLYTWDIVEISE